MQRLHLYTSYGLAVLLIASFLFAIPFASLHAATKKTAFEEAVSVSDLKAAYANATAGGDKVRVLVVPGHEPDYGGAQYSGYYERELAVDLSEKIATELRTDPNFEVLVARGMTGWNDDFDRYFDRSMSSVKKFVDEHKKAMKKLLKKGKLEENEEQASHNAAPDDVALRLYGITKWANDHEVDLMIHVHLNDTGGHTDTTPGAYSGLTIYVPDKQYGNAKASRAVAEPVFEALNELNATSTLPIEDKGIVEDQELIALGAYNTSEVPSILLEYGYIYEPKFTEEAVRPTVFTDMAFGTANGVKDFFGANVSNKYPTKVLPYTWTTDVTATSTTASTTASVGLYALQAALHELGFYPPSQTSLINCPIDGVMRDCVTNALKDYQTSKSLEATGALGPATRNALNAVFSSTPVVEAVVPTTPTPTTATCAPFTHTPELNSEDADTNGEVTRLQKQLAKDPTLYPEGKVTGFFGPATDKAVKALQTKKGLAKAGDAAYGVVGPKTSAALCAL